MSPLLSLLRDASLADTFTSTEWTIALSHARRTRMLPKLDTRLRADNRIATVPSTVNEVLDGIRNYVDYVHRRLRYEVSMLEALAADVDFPVVLLKGSAYIVTGAPCAPGRTVRDIDILVSRDHLDSMEKALRERGWGYKEDLTSYDESYYRTLSHELPPMRHPEFDFELDVHHSVIAPTHRYSVDMEAVLQEIVPVPGSAFFVLGAEDQIIHSATHLLTAEEFERGLRDLHDIHELVTALSARGTSADDILARARDVGLYEPVHQALGACRTHFGLVGRESSTLEGDTDHRISRKLVAWSLSHLLFDERGAPNVAKRIAAAYIWMRAQAMRMPWYTLLRHTCMKLTQRLKPEL